MGAPGKGKRGPGYKTKKERRDDPACHCVGLILHGYAMASCLTFRPVLDAAATRDAEAKLFAQGIDPLSLMEAAGSVAARAILAFAAPRSAVVACGPGNNGGDGYVVARHLAAAGVEVRVARFGHPVTPSAKSMAARWTNEVSEIGETVPGAVLVDAVFGIGSRPLDGALAAGLERLAHSSMCTIALDLPSGLDADTGAGRCVDADLTVAFGTLKPAHLFAARNCGRIVEIDLGLDKSNTDLFATESPRSLEPAWDSHKYVRGAVLILGGPAGQGGAARLAAHAAARVAGLVMIACPAMAVAENAAQLGAVMVRAADDAAAVSELIAGRRFASIAAGPSLGTDPDRLGAALASGLPIVLDADVFTVFAGDPAALAAALHGAGRLVRQTVLTPHEGEFVRLFGDLAGSRIDCARTAAAKVGAVVVLKGASTIIAAPDGRAAINAHATPWLATAGSGDVLTGIIAGLLAVGYEAFEAACAGAWLHGDAGQRAGPGLTADNLPCALAASIAAL